MRETDLKPFDLDKTWGDGQFFDLRTAKANPRLVVKELNLSLLKLDNENDDEAADFISYESIKEISQSIQKLINDLKTILGSDEVIPRSQVVVGINDDLDKTTFVISEKIEGTPLNTISDGEQMDITPDELNEEDKTQLLRIVEIMVELYIKNFDGENSEVPEFYSIHNYVKGRNASRDAGVRIYFIDLYPVFKMDPNTLIEHLDQLADDAEIPISSFETTIERIKGLLTK